MRLLATLHRRSARLEYVCHCHMYHNSTLTGETDEFQCQVYVFAIVAPPGGMLPPFLQVVIVFVQLKERK